MTDETVKIVRTRAYKIQRSNGEDIRIDEDELPKFVAGMASGTFMFFRQGGANPSYVTGIVPDKDRIREWVEECNYGFGQGGAAWARGIKPLQDILGLPQIAQRLKEMGSGVKRLN